MSGFARVESNIDEQLAHAYDLRLQLRTGRKRDGTAVSQKDIPKIRKNLKIVERSLRGLSPKRRQKR